MAADLIVVPARWGSTRFPGKPLTTIARRSLLHRVLDHAREALEAVEDVDLLVATDDQRIADHAALAGCRAVLTDPAIASGSGRALTAATMLADPPRFVVNLQGDALFVPASALVAVFAELRRFQAPCVTPVIQLDWQQLDRLREHKRRSPFSGTTCLRTSDGRALWFSKAILPVIRDEDQYRATSATSPVHQHLGLYGYSLDALRAFEALRPSIYERCEGLEQLRLLEAGIPIQTVVVQAPPALASGIDTPEDAARAERHLLAGESVAS